MISYLNCHLHSMNFNGHNIFQTFTYSVILTQNCIYSTIKSKIKKKDLDCNPSTQEDYLKIKVSLITN